jgi:hypothetical protein
MELPYLYGFDDGKLFSLAGLWESWKDPAVTNAEPVETFTLLTTEANSLAAEIHDRMPGDRASRRSPSMALGRGDSARSVADCWDVGETGEQGGEQLAE